MSSKPPRNHHYVPQVYLRNFAIDEKLYAFNTEIIKMFPTTPRNIASGRDLYRLEGHEPNLAEEMFRKIETAITPILNQIISINKLPPQDSDDFVSLLYFMAILEARHPNQLKKIENFMKTVYERSAEMLARYIPAEGRTLSGGEFITPQEARDAIEALNAVRIKLHIPKDHSLVASLKTADTITETLMNRKWTLAIADECGFVTSSKPVLLLWDDLSMHQRHPVGFGLKSTTVYFPISPKLMMIGKFEDVKEECLLDKNMVSAINALHLIYSPQYLISQNDQSFITIAPEQILFRNLEEAFRKLKDSSAENNELNKNSKILIVGTSGSGKSTLARTLSEKIGVPDIELDNLFWKENWTQSEPEEFRQKIMNAISKSSGFVIHGNYNKVRDLTWGHSNIVI